MLMIGCEKLSRLMDKEKEKNGKKMNRPAQSCGTISDGLMYMEVQSQKVQRESGAEEILEEKMAENFPEVMKEIR